MFPTRLSQPKETYLLWKSALQPGQLPSRHFQRHTVMIYIYGHISKKNSYLNVSSNTDTASQEPSTEAGIEIQQVQQDEPARQV